MSNRTHISLTAHLVCYISYLTHLITFIYNNYKTKKQRKEKNISTYPVRFLEVSSVRVPQGFPGHTGAATEVQLEKKWWAVPTVLWAVPGWLNRILDDDVHVIWKHWYWAQHPTTTKDPADALDPVRDEGRQRRRGGSRRWLGVVIAGCFVSSTMSWFSRAQPAVRAAVHLSKTTPVPLLYLQFCCQAVFDSTWVMLDAPVN